MDNADDSINRVRCGSSLKLSEPKLASIRFHSHPSVLFRFDVFLFDIFLQPH